MLMAAGVKYRFNKTLRISGNMIVAVSESGAHHCLECDSPLDAPVFTPEELNEMNRRDFGRTPTHTIAICDACYEKILNWYRTRQ